MIAMIGYTRGSKANRRKPDDPAHEIRRGRPSSWTIIWTDPDDGWTGATPDVRGSPPR